MPTLLLSEDSTLFCLEVLSYKNSKMTEDFVWCDIHIKIKNKYIDFDSVGEYLDNTEVEWLADYLKKLLAGEITEESEKSFTEPEINLKPSLPWDQYPDGKTLIYAKNGVIHHPLFLDIIIEFCSNGCYCGERWSVPLDREEIESFYNQLINEMELCDNKINIDNRNRSEITAEHISSLHGIYLDKENIDKMNEILNSNEELKKCIFGEKYQCARATYSEDGGKLYTFFVDEICHNCQWFVEDTEQEVFVKEFVVLAENDLPVKINKMKKIIHK